MIKTVTLQTAKLLKESGFKQNSHFCHYLNKHEDTAINTTADCLFYPVEFWDIFSAPTSDELLEEIPYGLRCTDCDYWLNIQKSRFDTYDVRYTDAFHNNVKIIEQGENLPEAIARMWLCLKKEKLI